MNFQETLASKETKVQTYEGAYQEYLDNPKSLLRKLVFTDNLNNKITRNIVKSEFHLDNEPYRLYRDYVIDLSKREEYLGMIDVEERFMNSTVALDRNRTLLRQHHSLRVETGVGHFCVSPYKDGLELTRIIIDERGKGWGTKMMQCLFSFINDSGCDLRTLPLMLECTGSVGGGSNYVETPLTLQTKFFRKFGFRVDQSVSNYKFGYVQMKFQNSLIGEFKKSLSL